MTKLIFLILEYFTNIQIQEFEIKCVGKYTHKKIVTLDKILLHCAQYV